MGVSTDGILFYGICLEEEAEIPWEGADEGDVDDVESYYASKAGVKPPEEEYSDDPKVKELYHEYWEAKNKAHEASKCDVVHHCSYDYPMFGLAVKESVESANRGYPQEVKSIAVQEDWDSLLKDYCEKMDVEYVQPKWWLVSMWG